MPFGLTERTVQRISEVFSRYPQIENATLYGSRAKGNFKSGSDIDIVLKGNALGLRVLNKISLELDDLYLPYIIDLAIFHQIDNQDLIEHVKRVGIELYKKKES